MATKNAKGLTEYRLLGRSGLRVSPLCLGTMTFGTAWGWGSDEQTSERILRRYLEAGGNFIDTADGYTKGQSEEMLGRFLSSGDTRDRVVLATKFTFSARPGDPNAGGNGRKNILRALEGSLKRLRTDYVDLYWLYAWDTFTPIEEVMGTIDALVRSGKVRYFGLSDVPAWYLARAQTLAELRGWERICALQLEYSLVERSIEREHIPAAGELGMGLCPWSPLAGGFLAGKYKRGQSGGSEGRLVSANAFVGLDQFSERDWSVLKTLVEGAEEVGKSPAQVALRWVTERPGVVSTVIGATKLQQLEDNLAALEVEIPASLSQRLEEQGRPELGHPYSFFTPEMQATVTGGVRVRR